ncbi:MAG: hypothetical protein HYZ53_02005 [Planctomycetes bacterium]|nr:hypothetical protein [Planctomycetota bacterium]
MTEPSPVPSAESGPGPLLGEFGRAVLVWGVGVVSVFYLLNVGRGDIPGRIVGGRLGELLPDDVPFLGNLDEFVASLLLLSVCRYFGLDLCAFLFPARRRER